MLIPPTFAPIHYALHGTDQVLMCDVRVLTSGLI